ncbi:serine protease [Pseudonocardiaceae bacterium YIM PH 21723]|nr:serine protease [Pseudonocardiaceae bacterium YIM PH 21723]
MHTRTKLLLGAALVAALGGAALPASVIPVAQGIIGGSESKSPYPFLGSLQRPEGPGANSHACGMTLIAPQWAVTGAHCLRNVGDRLVGTPRGWTVRFGSLDNGSGGQVAEIDKYYRTSNYYRESDMGLVHLKSPVTGETAKLPAARYPEGTPARIVGWGKTCTDNETCYPSKLHEADTQIQPTATCDPFHPEAEICVGAKDGSVRAENTDSGGPALVRDGDRWVVAGTTFIGESYAPTVYEDTHHWSGWLNGIMDGSKVPADDPVPNTTGAIDLRGCTGSVVRTAESKPQDPALVLTNGHCAAIYRPDPQDPDNTLVERPEPGSAWVDRETKGETYLLDPAGYVRTKAKKARLLYATMTGTDVALYRLDKTYAQLESEGATIFQLGTGAAKPGDKVGIVSALTTRYACTIETIVPKLREGGYEQSGAYRYDPKCGPSHGESGSAILAADGTTVIGVHNTGNDEGEKCTENNPCEVDANGTVSVHKGIRYGQQTGMLPACIGPASTVDLNRPGCTLTRPKG